MKITGINSGVQKEDRDTMHPSKIIVEKHPDGYVAYSVGIKGVVIGEGDTYDEAVADVTSAIRFHKETFNDPGSRD